jgi:hypothetical protein
MRPSGSCMMFERDHVVVMISTGDDEMALCA